MRVVTKHINEAKWPPAETYLHFARILLVIIIIIIIMFFITIADKRCKGQSATSATQDSTL